MPQVQHSVRIIQGRDDKSDIPVALGKNIFGCVHSGRKLVNSHSRTSLKLVDPENTIRHFHVFHHFIEGLALVNGIQDQSVYPVTCEHSDQLFLRFLVVLMNRDIQNVIILKHPPSDGVHDFGEIKVAQIHNHNADHHTPAKNQASCGQIRFISKSFRRIQYALFCLRADTSGSIQGSDYRCS